MACVLLCYILAAYVVGDFWGSDYADELHRSCRLDYPSLDIASEIEGLVENLHSRHHGVQLAAASLLSLLSKDQDYFIVINKYRKEIVDTGERDDVVLQKTLRPLHLLFREGVNQDAAR